MHPRKQTFSLAGVTKCGTSSLHAYLSQHPEICVSSPKEPWCFEDPAAYAAYRANDFADYYRSSFPTYRGQIAVGDCNPRKLTFPWSLRLLHKEMPEGKILILVRNPAQRAFSEWWMDFCAGSEKLNFENALEENAKSQARGLVFHEDEETAMKLWPNWFSSRRLRQPAPTRILLGSGYYWKGVERAQRLFSPEKVKVVVLEQLKLQPQTVLKEIFEFLEVRSDMALDGSTEHNVGCGEWARKTAALARKTGLPKILSFQYRDRLLSRLNNAFRKLGDKRPVLRPDTRQYLDDHYREHNQRLVELTGIDLSSWEKTSPPAFDQSAVSARRTPNPAV